MTTGLFHLKPYILGDCRKRESVIPATRFRRVSIILNILDKRKILRTARITVTHDDGASRQTGVVSVM